MSVNVLDALRGWSIHSGPLYRKLATAIENAVNRGDLPPGTVLPAERHLARALTVGRSTVVGAYDLLRSAGVVTSRQGSGTWVSGADRNAESQSVHPESLLGAALAGSDETVDLATASLPAAAAVRDALAAMRGELLEGLLDHSGYSAQGLPELRLAVADMFSREGLPTTAEQVLITTGDQQALSLILPHFLELGDSVVVEDPTSPGVLDLLRDMPVVIRNARSLSSSGSRGLLDIVAKSNPTLVYLLTSLGPEGYISDPHELRRFAEGTRDFDGVIVEDTSSRQLAPGTLPPYLASLARGTSVLTIGSMSKLFWGGLRIGWIRGDENIILRLARAKAKADLGTPLLSQLVSAWLLHRQKEVREQRLAELAARSADAAATIAKHLPSFSIDEYSGGVTLWMQMPRGASRPFAELARRYGVAIVPGDSLSPAGACDQFIRLSLGRSSAAFEDGVERLARAWSEYDSTASESGRATDDPPLV